MAIFRGGQRNDEDDTKKIAIQVGSNKNVPLLERLEKKIVLKPTTSGEASPSF
jgi:hypothetical protein